MVGDDLEVGMPVEETRERKPRHRDGGIVGPAEAPPHLEARARLGGIVGGLGAPRWMEPDWHVLRRDRGEERPIDRIVERPALDVGKDLHAARAKMAGRALELSDRTF